MWLRVTGDKSMLVGRIANDKAGSKYCVTDFIIAGELAHRTSASIRMINICISRIAELDEILLTEKSAVLMEAT